jgi:hypothetical protein
MGAFGRTRDKPSYSGFGKAYAKFLLGERPKKPTPGQFGLYPGFADQVRWNVDSALSGLKKGQRRGSL